MHQIGAMPFNFANRYTASGSQGGAILPPYQVAAPTLISP